MTVSTRLRTANLACGALGYFWFVVSWALALVPGYLTWLLLAASGYGLPPEAKAFVVLVAFAVLTVTLLAWPLVYLWLYDRWQVKHGL
jgi:hypothetical protein